MFTRLNGLLTIPNYPRMAFATLLLGTALSFTTPYLSLFGIKQAGLSPLHLGVFLTLNAAANVVMSTLAGRWSDRHGKHQAALIVALVMAAVGYATLCFARSYTALLIVGIVFLGTGGSALALVFAFARVGLAFRSVTERAFATASLRTTVSTAWIFGPSVGALVLAAADFRGLFVFAAASFLGAAMMVRSIRPPADGLGLAGSAGRMPDEPQLHVSPGHRAVLVRSLAALTLIGLGANANMIVLPLFIVDGLHGSHLDVSAMLGTAALLEIPMMLWLGAHTERLDKPRWLAACGAAQALAFAGLSLAPSVGWLLPVQVLNAFVIAASNCLGMPYIQSMMPDRPASATALFFNATRVGSVAAGILSGAVMSLAGFTGAFLGCAMLALCSVALLIRLEPQAVAARPKASVQR